MYSFIVIVTPYIGGCNTNSSLDFIGLFVNRLPFRALNRYCFAESPGFSPGGSVEFGRHVLSEGS